MLRKWRKPLRAKQTNYVLIPSRKRLEKQRATRLIRWCELLRVDAAQMEEALTGKADELRSHPVAEAAGETAGDEIRTRDINLGKVALYQLSYARVTSSGSYCQSRNVRQVKFPGKCS